MKATKKIGVMLSLLLFFAPIILQAQTVEDYEREAKILEAKKKVTKARRSAAAAEIPCQAYDSDDYYVGTGKARVLVTKLNTDEYTKLLKSCQLLLKSKIKGRYTAVVRDYFNQMDIDGSSSVGSHIESAGEQVVDQYLNDTEETCREETDEDNEGYVTVYMNVQIKKRDLVNALAKGLSKEMTKKEVEDKTLKVRFNEEQFRNSALKIFEEKDKKDAEKESVEKESIEKE